MQKSIRRPFFGEKVLKNMAAGSLYNKKKVRMLVDSILMYDTFYDYRTELSFFLLRYSLHIEAVFKFWPNKCSSVIKLNILSNKLNKLGRYV